MRSNDPKQNRTLGTIAHAICDGFVATGQPRPNGDILHDVLFRVLEGAGMVVVPVEATTAMLAAGQTAWLSDTQRRSSTLYAAMVEAGRVR